MAGNTCRVPSSSLVLGFSPQSAASAYMPACAVPVRRSTRSVGAGKSQVRKARTLQRLRARTLLPAAGIFGVYPLTQTPSPAVSYAQACRMGQHRPQTTSSLQCGTSRLHRPQPLLSTAMALQLPRRCAACKLARSRCALQTPDAHARKKC